REGCAREIDCLPLEASTHCRAMACANPSSGCDLGGNSMFRSARRVINSPVRHRFRLSTIERLERREMLSSVPPTVVDIEVASTAWSSAFVDYLQTEGLG